MKSVTCFSIALGALGLSLAQSARADSFALRVHDRNASVGVSIGTAPWGLISVVPPQVQYRQPACRRETGYWATDGYRQAWVSPGYSSSGYWVQPSYEREHERHEHEWREHEWHEHEWRDHHRDWR